MARGKISSNRDELRSADSGSTDVVFGTDGVSTAEDIRPNEGSASGKTEGEGIFNPAELDASNEPGESSGEQWFPKRNKRNKKPRASKEAASDLNGLLWMIHQGLATLTGIEEFAIDPKESEELAKSIARVQSYYPNTILSGEAMAWSALAVSVGKIYGTRIIAVTTKKKKKPELLKIPTAPGTVSVSEANEVAVL